MGAAMLTSGLLLSKGAAAPSCMDDRPLPAGGGARLTMPASAKEDSLARLVSGQAMPEAGHTCIHDSASRAGASRARISVRLDPQRHLRLRLLAAHKQAHIQDILVEALDDYVARMAPGLGLQTCKCLSMEAAAGNPEDLQETA